MTYTVQGDGIHVGYHPTPGLALRALWREIERRIIMNEQPTGYQYLSRRRHYALQRRFLRSHEPPRTEPFEPLTPQDEPRGESREGPRDERLMP